MNLRYHFDLNQLYVFFYPQKPPATGVDTLAAYLKSIPTFLCTIVPNSTMPTYFKGVRPDYIKPFNIYIPLAVVVYLEVDMRQVQ